MKRTKLLLGLLVFSVIMVVSYIYLGGTNEVVISEEQVANYTLVGKDYIGRYRDTELRDIYFDLKGKVDNGELKGILTIINYEMDPDSTKSGFIHQFLGVSVAENKTQYLEDYSTTVIPVQAVLKAKVKAHNLVMPKPESVEKQLHSYAKERNLVLQNFTIEQYVSDRELDIVIPVIK